MASFETGSRGSAHLPPARFHAETIDDCYLAGDGPAIQKVRSQLLRIAPYVRVALIVGESGSGKQVVARALHERSAGAHGPLIVHDARRFVEGLLTDGHSVSALREAHGGTLFLQHLCELPVALQSRLLRTLRLHEEHRSQRCDLRIIGSSRRDLRTLAATGQFHEELYRRVAAVEITLQPLRKRLADLPFIVEAMMPHLGSGIGLTTEALTSLQQHAWPGNLRELQRVLEQAAARAEAGVIASHDLHLLCDPETKPTVASGQRLERLQDVVQRHVLEVLTHCSGNKLRASEVLGISRSTLYRMLDTGAMTAGAEYTG